MSFRHLMIGRKLFILAALFTTLAGCQTKLPQDLRGITLPEPKTKPAVVLTDTLGRPFDFRRETKGKLTLLFFGYTYCPDICPMHMANIAAVLREMPYEVKSNTQVIFVTVDPRRDTPQRLGQWLHQFSPAFIGLQGDDAVVARFQRELNLAEAVTSPAKDGGEYSVGHAAQVIAFTPDGLGRYVYPFGTRQQDWGHDLPLLATGRPSSKLAPSHSAMLAAKEGEQAAITIPLAVIPSPSADGPGVLYAVIKNSGHREDALIGIATPLLAGRVELHRMAHEGGRMMMQAVSSVTLPARGELRLAPGGTHAMLLALKGPAAVGGRVPVTFTFRNAGPVTAGAQVVLYEQVEPLLKTVK